MVPAFLIVNNFLPHDRPHEIQRVPFFVLLANSDGVSEIILRLQTGQITLIRGFGLPRDPVLFAEVLPKQT